MLWDSTKYLIENIDRIAEEDYKPTYDDLLRCRVRTTGVKNITFVIKNTKFSCVDVGGQRSERRKWIHCFDNCTAVLFFVALNEYDMTLYEDTSVNRMRESMELFDQICNGPYFMDTDIILFLNKEDLFRKKIKRVNITTCFPEYTGRQNFEDASQYILEQFLDLRNDPQKAVYYHITTATDTENIRFVFNSVRSMIIEQNLKVNFF
eukprot:TRINITY_DN2616_c0_g1_i1.p1 TRINITY_DN2616_c0_g1~~TRINITY_DN2616_c0_g1_i1.p1  ORF type:complete len:207 (-),score=36.34 TRINITY_DN2616_c0_g1_i1:29-649(-)